LPKTTRVWTEGLEGWKQAAEVEDLLPSASPPPESKTAKAADSAVAEGMGEKIENLFSNRLVRWLVLAGIGIVVGGPFLIERFPRVALAFCLTGFGLMIVAVIVLALPPSSIAGQAVRRRLSAIAGLGAARLCVITYVLFVVGSLFCAPWEGWTSKRADIWDSYSFDRGTRYGWVFSPPQSMWGTDGTGKATRSLPPRLKIEQLVLLWGAFGIVTVAVVWLASGKKPGNQNNSAGSAESPVKTPLVR
jgi:hypothetical protein